MASPLHISISAEKVLSVGALNISNSMITSLIVSGLIIAFALAVNLSLKKTNRPTGLQNFGELIVESLTSLVQSVTNDKKKTELFFPFIATFFIFILMNNWFGLLPGVGTIGFYEEPEAAEHVTAAEAQPVLAANEEKSINVGDHSDTAETHAATDTHAVTTTDEHGTTKTTDVKTDESHAAVTPLMATAEKVTETPEVHTEVAETEEHHGPVFVPYLRAGTADLNTTLALGIISITIVQIFGFIHLKIGYFGKYINFASPITFFVGLLEIVSEISRIISFAFRLFGNVFAGEVLLAVIGFLAPLVAPMPFYGLEIFVGFIQALVFAMLSVVFFNMATLGHGDDH